MNSKASPIRVLFIERGDSPCGTTAGMASTDASFEVHCGIPDPFAAREKIKEIQPHVLVLDLEMDRMDSMLFIRILMNQAPMPVVALTSLSDKGSSLALDALELGAADVFVRCSAAHVAPEQLRDFTVKLKNAARATFRQPYKKGSVESEGQPFGGSKTLVLLGASTGGTEALREILAPLPPTMPPICIVQHIPSDFSGPFAERLNSVSSLSVKEATDGDELKSGRVFVAPGNKHMLLARSSSGKLILKIRDGDKVMHHRPSIDLMFESAASVAAPQSIAGLLTGMGRDGASGLLKLRQAGAKTFAQDEKTSVVFGMPRAALDLGATDKTIPLLDISDFLIRSCRPRTTAAGTKV